MIGDMPFQKTKTDDGSPGASAICGKKGPQQGCLSTLISENEGKTGEDPYVFNSAADPVQVELDTVFLLQSPHNGFKNHLVTNIFGEFNSKNSPCSSKKSTNHELPISCPEITNNATFNSEAI